MAASLDGIFEKDLQNLILNSKIFVVGAGGIGCELLKNLVLAGFKDIEIIDLDTIDVSNLNRQFLFHKQHVGKSKAAIATESALQFNPNVNIKYYHDSVIGNDFNVAFFERFKVVLNALDNLTARYHVNRMCLAAGIPLIESGTAGYDGQVELIKGGLTSCYECTPKRRPKDFPGCTIRNTPSEPIHCIVWAKHLFNQLFGEPDEDVSPDTADPELEEDSEFQEKKDANFVQAERKSTREWAEETNYDPDLLFNKFFKEDINYLLTMATLWKNRGRKAPIPLDINNVPDSVPGSSKEDSGPGLKEMALWSIAECVQVFRDSVNTLKKQLEGLSEGSHLIWDKDDKEAMDFVAACTNIRCYIFHIEQKTRFEIKSMAGNIIPAIATTNAIIAGVVVLRAFNVLRDKYEACPTVYLRRKQDLQGRVLVPERGLIPPNSSCIVCAKPQVNLRCNIATLTVKELEEAVLKKTLLMVAPDVIVKTSFNMIISSEEGETECNNDKTLKEMGVEDGSVLQADDYLQNYKLEIMVRQYEAPKNEPEFLLTTEGSSGDINVGPQPESTTQKNGKEEEAADGGDDDLIMMEDDDDMMVVETPQPSSAKRKMDDDNGGAVPLKKRAYNNDDVIVL